MLTVGACHGFSESRAAQNSFLASPPRAVPADLVDSAEEESGISGCGSLSSSCQHLVGERGPTDFAWIGKCACGSPLTVQWRGVSCRVH